MSGNGTGEMTAVREAGAPAETREIRVLDLGTVLLRRWKTVLGTAALLVTLAVAVALLRPKVYATRTVLLAVSEQGDGPALRLASEIAGLSGLVRPSNSGQDLIGAISKSRSLADSIVVRLQAGRPRDPAGEAAIRRVLERGIKITPNPDGSIVIDVRGRDPELVTRIANAFPEVINTLSSRINVQAARRRQEFLENQLDEARERLVASEQRLVAFQTGRNAPEIADQARRSVDAAAALQQQIIEQEIRVAQMRRSATMDNPELRAAVAELEARRAQLQRMIGGDSGGARLFPSLRQSPELKVDVTRLMREYTKDEQIYLSLTAALAQTRIDVNNNLPLVSVLDAAVVPTAPANRGLKLIVVVAGMLGLLLGLVLAFTREFLARARRRAEDQAFFSAWEEFRGDLARYLPYRKVAAGRSGRA